MSGRFFGGGSTRARATRPVPPVVALAVGAMIDSVCGKCKRATSHRVARKVGVQPTLLECTECAELHAYRSPAASAAAKRKREETMAAARISTPEEAWTRAMKRAVGAPIVYSSARHFPVGQRLSHAQFGDGVVTSRGSGTVCTVVFQSGEKKLLMGSPERGAPGELDS